MKKLYARFYKNTNDARPEEEHFLCVSNCGSRETQESLKLNTYNTMVWLQAYPLGKVEIVWS